MKKNLLLVAALLCSVAVSAQSTWSCITTCSEDGKNITGTANLKGTTTESNIAMSDITYGAGIVAPATCQKAWKDASGTSTNYAGDGEAIIKWVPSCTQDATIKDINEAYAAGQYVEFGLVIDNDFDYLNLGSLTLDAVRLGTDAVRINVRIIASTFENGDDGLDTGWLINEDNWSTIAGGVGKYYEGEAGGEIIPGYQPSREDESKDFSSTGQGCSKLNIPLSVLPAETYGVKARIVVSGIANNKALGLRNVSFESTGGGTGIQNNVTVDESVPSKYYTVSGIEVKEPVKGINIVKQTMTDGSVKYIKEVR